MKAYQILDFSHLLGMEGFSDTLLKNHFTLYQGYVNNTNKVMETLENMAKAGNRETLSMPNSNGALGGNGTACASTSFIFRISEVTATPVRPRP